MPFGPAPDEPIESNPLFDPPAKDEPANESDSLAAIFAPKAEPPTDDPNAISAAWRALTDTLPPPPSEPAVSIPPPTGDPEHPDTRLAAILAGEEIVDPPSEPPRFDKPDESWLSEDVPTPAAPSSDVPLLELTDDDPFDVALGQALNEELFDAAEPAGPRAAPTRRPSSVSDADEELIDMAASSIDPAAFDDAEDDDVAIVAEPNADRKPVLSTDTLTPLWSSEADPEVPDEPATVQPPTSDSDNELAALSDELARLGDALTSDPEPEPKDRGPLDDVSSLLGPITDEELTNLGKNLTDDIEPLEGPPALDSLDMVEPLMPSVSEAPSGLVDAEDVIPTGDPSALYAEPPPLLTEQGPDDDAEAPAFVDPGSLDLTDDADQDNASEEAAVATTAEADLADLDRAAEAELAALALDDAVGETGIRDEHAVHALDPEELAAALAPAALDMPTVNELAAEPPMAGESSLAAESPPPDVSTKSNADTSLPPLPASFVSPVDEESDVATPTLLVRRRRTMRADAPPPRTEPMPPLEPMDEPRGPYDFDSATVVEEADDMAVRFEPPPAPPLADSEADDAVRFEPPPAAPPPAAPSADGQADEDAVGFDAPPAAPSGSGLPKGSTRITVTGVAPDGAPMPAEPSSPKPAPTGPPKPVFRPAREQRASFEEALVRPLPTSILPDPAALPNAPMRTGHRPPRRSPSISRSRSSRPTRAVGASPAAPRRSPATVFTVSRSMSPRRTERKRTSPIGRPISRPPTSPTWPRSPPRSPRNPRH